MHVPLLFVGKVGTEVVVAINMLCGCAAIREHPSIFKPNFRVDSQFDNPMAVAANLHCSGKIKSTTQLASNFVMWVSGKFTPFIASYIVATPKQGLQDVLYFHLLQNRIEMPSLKL